MINLLQFPRKGSRSYNHGTDLFHRTEELFRDGDPSAYIKRFSIRTITHNRCELRTSDEPLGDDVPVADFVIMGASGETAGYIIETDAPVTDRIEYDEDSITSDADFSDKTIVQRSKTAFLAIEEVVALTKSLHYSAFPEVKKKWFFLKIDLTVCLRDVSSELFEVSVAQKLGERLTISDLSAGNEKIGRIYFGVPSE